MSFQSDQKKEFNRALKEVEKNRKRIAKFFKNQMLVIRGLVEEFNENQTIGLPLSTSREIRLAELYKAINAELSKLNGQIKRLITNEFEKAMFESYYSNSFNIEKALNVDDVVKQQLGVDPKVGYRLNVDMLRYEQIEAAFNKEVAGMTFSDRVVWIRNKLQGMVRQEVAGAITEGISVKELAKRLAGISKKMKLSQSEWERIARTEYLRAYSIAQEESDRQAEDLGLELTYIWDATLDGKTRPAHGTADGQEAKKDDDGNPYFIVGGEKMSAPRMGYNGSTPSAKNVVNCVVSNTIVGSDSLIKKFFKRYYSGKVVKISTSGGSNITVTPNHPILTERGWIRSNDIKKFDKIGCVDRRLYVNKISYPDKNNMPAIVDKVFNFFFAMFDSCRIPGIDMQFHGDGSYSDVDIIFVHSKLMDRVKSIFRQFVYKFNFTVSNFCKVFLIANSFVYKFFFRRFFAFSGNVGLFSKAFPFFFGSVGHPHKHAFTSVSGSVPNFIKSSINCISGNSDFGRDRLDRLSGLVFFDDIIDIEIFNYSGHVYNLHTDNNYYFANDISCNDNVKQIVVHNCRCRRSSTIGAIERRSRLARTYDENGKEKWEKTNGNITYSEWSKTEQGKEAIQKEKEKKAKKAARKKAA